MKSISNNFTRGMEELTYTVRRKEGDEEDEENQSDIYKLGLQGGVTRRVLRVVI